MRIGRFKVKVRVRRPRVGGELERRLLLLAGLAVVLWAASMAAMHDAPTFGVYESHSVLGDLKDSVQDMALAFSLLGFLLIPAGIAAKSPQLLVAGIAMLLLAAPMADILNGVINGDDAGVSEEEVEEGSLKKVGDGVLVGKWAKDRATSDTPFGARVCIYDIANSSYCVPAEGFKSSWVGVGLSLKGTMVSRVLDRIAVYVRGGPVGARVRVTLYAGMGVSKMDFDALSESGRVEGKLFPMGSKTVDLREDEVAVVTFTADELLHGWFAPTPPFKYPGLNNPDINDLLINYKGKLPLSVVVWFYTKDAKKISESVKPFKVVYFDGQVAMVPLDEEELNRLLSQPPVGEEPPAWWDEMVDQLQSEYDRCVAKCQAEGWANDPAYRSIWRGSCESTCAVWLNYHSTITLDVVKDWLWVGTSTLNLIVLAYTVKTILTARRQGRR